jgi:hypothetical protein
MIVDPDLVPAIIVMVIGTPICFVAYHLYCKRWFRRHGRTEDVLFNYLNDTNRNDEEV